MITKTLILISLLGVSPLLSAEKKLGEPGSSIFERNIAETTRPNLLLQFGKSIKMNDLDPNDYLNTFVTGKDELCISLRGNQVPYYTFSPAQTKEFIKYVKQGLTLMDLIKKNNFATTKELGQFKLGDYYTITITLDNINEQKKGTIIPYFAMKFYSEGEPDVYTLAQLNETALKELLEQLTTIDKAIEQVHEIQKALDKEEPTPQPSTGN